MMNNSSKRLLICSPGIPHKSRGASTVLFYHYIERLKRSGFKIINLLLLQTGQYTEEALTEYAANMTEPGSFEILPCRADNFIIFARFSIKLNTAALDGVLRQARIFQPDAIFCLDLLSAWVGKQIASGAKLVWLGDLNFQTGWYHAWYAVKENIVNARKLPHRWFRCLVWKKIYKDVLQDADSVIVSSKSSEMHLGKLGIYSNYQPYPWSNNICEAKAYQVKRHTMPSFLFFGTLVALGSRSAFHFMIEKLYPHLLRCWGNHGFQIFIAGRYQLPKWFENELADKPEFKCLGFVDDLDSLMASCHAVLAPIDIPVGNRSRIVTAMAKRALVIAHKNAALGNPDLVNEVTCYLASNADEFVRYMQKTVDCPKQVEEIVANARHCYEQRFHPDVACEIFFDALLHVIEQKSIEGKPM